MAISKVLLNSLQKESIVTLDEQREVEILIQSLALGRVCWSGWYRISKSIRVWWCENMVMDSTKLYGKTCKA